MSENAVVEKVEDIEKKWTRPIDLEFPHTYHKFTAKDALGEQDVNYIVQDIPEDRFDDVVKFMLEHYLVDEPTIASRKGFEDPQTVEDMTNEWRHLLNKRISQVCFIEDSDEIIGVNLLEVVHKLDQAEIFVSAPNWNSFPLQKFIKNASIFKNFPFRPHLFQGHSKNYLDQYCVVEYVLEMSDIFYRFHVDQYLRSCGLAINKEYRRRGIASEMYKAKFATLEIFGLELCSGAFTSEGSSKAAENAGFELIFEIS